MEEQSRGHVIHTEGWGWGARGTQGRLPGGGGSLFKINYFLAVLGQCCCAWAFSFLMGCSEWGLLSSCGVRAYCSGFLLQSMCTRARGLQ